MRGGAAMGAGPPRESPPREMPGAETISTRATIATGVRGGKAVAAAVEMVLGVAVGTVMIEIEEIIEIETEEETETGAAVMLAATTKEATIGVVDATETETGGTETETLAEDGTATLVRGARAGTARAGGGSGLGLALGGLARVLGGTKRFACFSARLGAVRGGTTAPTPIETFCGFELCFAFISHISLI